MSTPFRLQVPRHLYEEMLAQAAAELPNECCGILAGRVVEGNECSPIGQVARRYALVNAAASAVEYLSDARSMFDAVREMQKEGTDILAVYHSHPTSDPVPSRKDLERNYSPDVVNLIVSLKPAQPRVQAWWLTDEAFFPADWEIV